MLTNTTAMQLSDRVNLIKPSSTLAVSARVKAMRADGIDVIGFGAGEPDFETPDNIKQAAIDALNAGETHYMPSAGDPAARQSIARKLKAENGIECGAEHVIISAGAKNSLYLALQCLISPGRGQQVIIPTPAWVSYFPFAVLAGAEVVEVPGAVSNGFKITPEQLEQSITDDSAVFMLNSPSNPCGIMYSPDELGALAGVLERHEHVTIIADEIYEKLIYGDMRHYSLGSRASLADRVVTINGLSKAYAMTGWRIGYACAPGDDGALIKAMTKMQSQMTSCITSFCYASIVEALDNGAEDVESMRQEFEKRAELIGGLVDAWPDVTSPRPTSAFYVFPDVSAHFGKTSPGGRSIDSALSLAEALLEEKRVAVVPGEDFGVSARGHMRLSFATSPEKITEGCTRIGEWLSTLR